MVRRVRPPWHDFILIRVQETSSAGEIPSDVTRRRRSWWQGRRRWWSGANLEELLTVIPGGRRTVEWGGESGKVVVIGLRCGAPMNALNVY